MVNRTLDLKLAANESMHGGDRVAVNGVKLELSGQWVPKLELGNQGKNC